MKNQQRNKNLLYFTFLYSFFSPQGIPHPYLRQNKDNFMTKYLFRGDITPLFLATSRNFTSIAHELSNLKLWQKTRAEVLSPHSCVIFCYHINFLPSVLDLIQYDWSKPYIKALQSIIVSNLAMCAKKYHAAVSAEFSSSLPKLRSVGYVMN